MTPATTDPGDERSGAVPVISADCHAGANLYAYLDYLPRSWHAAFEDWARTFSDPWAGEALDLPTIVAGVQSGASPLNWSNGARLADLDADGIAAEVLFPNTAPPFFPGGVFTASAPRSRREYEQRMAGLRAHNRWLVDFCAEAPGRRAGVAQVFLNDVDDTLAEIRWAKEAGLTGGILLPADTQLELVPLYYPRYDAIWQLCEEMEVPVHRHGSVPAEPLGPETGPGAKAIGLVETRFFAHRALAHLVFAGVFERFPGLRFVFTESGAGWVPRELAALDAIVRAGRVPGSMASQFVGDALEGLTRLPSEYFATSCYVGASFLTGAEAGLRHEIGVDRLMWGSDYPHAEGTFPFSREALQLAFTGVPAGEILQVVSSTAASVYGFDLEMLADIASAIRAPTMTELSAEPNRLPRFPDDTVSPAFAGTQGHFVQ